MILDKVFIIIINIIMMY